MRLKPVHVVFAAGLLAICVQFWMSVALRSHCESSIAFSVARSWRWQTVRNEFAKEHPVCAACDRRSSEIHHIVPFSVEPSKECDTNNLIALCARHHFAIGHLENYRSWNTNVISDAAGWKLRLSTRPAKKEEVSQ